MTSSSAPLTITAHAPTGVVAAGADLLTPVVVCPVAGTVAAVRVVPAAPGLTGAATNNRQHTVYNRGAAGAGTTVVAQRAYGAGVNSAQRVATAVALSGTPANLVVAAGDVLEWESLHVGTGIADPGCLVEIDITRTQAE